MKVQRQFWKHINSIYVRERLWTSSMWGQKYLEKAKLKVSENFKQKKFNLRFH